MHVSIALEAIGSAIGEAMETLDVQRGAERSTPDVVVPVAGEDQVDETPAPVPAELGDMTIGADDE
jgi:AmiR/NasT family two-component response regulator